MLLFNARAARANDARRCSRRTALLIALALMAGMMGFPHPAAAGKPAALPADPAWFAGRIFDEMNADRVAWGLAPLGVSEDAARVADARAADMAAGGYFAHTNPSGVGAFDLLLAFGVPFRRMGENIALSTQPDPRIPGVIEQRWMESPGHRRNILDPSFREVGVAVVQVGDDVLVAVVFLG